MYWVLNFKHTITQQQLWMNHSSLQSNFTKPDVRVNLAYAQILDWSSCIYVYQPVAIGHLTQIWEKIFDFRLKLLSNNLSQAGSTHQAGQTTFQV